MQWKRLEGNYREVGRALGLHWGRLLAQKSAYWKHWREIVASELADAWEDAMLPLLRNAFLHFPELVEEIAGLAQGAVEAGFDTSFPDLFAHALGETVEDIAEPHCSSIVVHAANGIVIGHNEEWYIEREGGQNAALTLTPLAFCDVSLQRNNGDRIRFASVSYPFQLFGTSTGMNTRIAVVGNSIGCGRQGERLRATWDNRVPATFFSRKMLELSSVKQAIALYRQHHSTLPHHRYVGDARRCYSLEIRPVRRTDKSAAQQMKVRRTHDVSIHTNHFAGDTRWCWDATGMADSRDRLDALARLVKDRDPRTKHTVSTMLHQLQRRYPEQTLATLIFRLAAGRSSCEARCHFQTSPRELPALTFRNDKR